jgi:hypothetical protein
LLETLWRTYREVTTWFTGAIGVARRAIMHRLPDGPDLSH